MTDRHPGVYKRLLAYFAANPDEELTRSDMVTKFSVSYRTVEGVLAKARKEGTLESAHVYRLPNHKRGAA